MRVVSKPIIGCIFISLLSVSRGWSFWGSDEEPAEEEKTFDEKVTLDDDIEDKENENTNSDSNGEHFTIDQINQMNKEEIQKKLEETLRAHELHHLSQETHFDDIGDHNLDFDHEAFMGDEAKEFKNLTPEQSKEKLSKIVLKIDKNGDKLIDVPELTQWIIDTQNRSVVRRTNEFWASSNPDQKEELSWDEYRAIQYGFLTDEAISGKDRRWKMEDDVDPETLRQFQELELRDRRRWTVADRDKNLHLTKKEFEAFIHPEHYEHMYSVNRDETMADLDTDNDGQLSLAEFVKHLYGETKSAADWDNAGLQFRTFRDHNKDGVIDKDELMLWIHPKEYDTHQAEAEHLVREADSNDDMKLTMEEVLENYSIFVSSQATDFGQDLHYHHDEL